MTDLIENRSTWFDLLFRGTFALLLLQNALLVFAIYNIPEDSLDITDFAKYALIIDMIGFALVIIIAAIMVLIVKKDSILWMIIGGGSALFIMGSLAWRPMFDIIPENSISSFFNDLLLTNTEITASSDVIEKLAEGWNAILMSNFGLFAFAVGLAFAVPDSRIKLPMVIYGIINVGFTMMGLGIPFKPLLSFPFILIAFVTIISKPLYTFYQTKIPPDGKRFEPRIGQQY